ncbi:hypothetical protein COU18_03740 [Candidatus Kaiserbacteria bacterium CG10_big_fil_rev_8_21_14_0_10_51_14]|uniref:Ig-like domain-containing protein n=1 Tax=Candidatus Kaiserbacteria bacterium CG10_big_fil_rev_8_21_14_0_10_51_14 TaxID=1974610 RepID=A0A2H0UBJ8_9BACT|nr:MAG: hypothetical protein COU18_03740 [Candidatus Kaiserbacteria bacterium CG10_big_fil_rev_8_21_14_0_10_51_14]
MKISKKLVLCAALAIAAPIFAYADVGYEPSYDYSYGGYAPTYSYGGYSPSYSYGGYEPTYSYGGYEPTYSYGGYEPTYSYGGYEPSYSYGGYEPTYSYGGYEPTYSYGGYEPTYSYGGYEPTYSYGGYEPSYSYGGYEPIYDYGGYESVFSYGGYEPSYSYGGYEPTYSYGGYEPTYDYGTYEPTPSYNTYNNTYDVYDVYQTANTYAVAQVYQQGVGYTYTPTSYVASAGCGYNCGTTVSQQPFNFGCGSVCHQTPPPTPCCAQPPHQNPPCCAPQPSQPPVIINNPPAPSQPINIVNNNTNTNTNVNTNTNTAPVVPVVQAPVTYPVQYVYPTPTYYPPTYYPTPTYPTYQAQPYCTITISGNAYGNYGAYSNQLATISWSSSNATSAWISPNIGSVPTFGTRTVYPTGNTVYTMTVSGPGGTATCQTTAYYAPTYPTPYVSLTQIPYTGLDLGPIGTVLYWLSLLSFAAAGAYLLVYYKGGAMALASQMIGFASPKLTGAKAGRVFSKVENVVTKTAEKIDAVIEPVLSSLQNLPVKEGSSEISDSMTLVHSKDGEAPRIVITRN